MSMPMNNLEKGGYVPPGYNPNVVPTAPGLAPQNYNHPQGYAPVPQQMPYGEAPPFGSGVQQPSYAGPPPAGFAPQYNTGGGFQPGYAPPQGPIMHQPGQPGMVPGPMPPQGPPGEWMSIPAASANCPRGLEYLMSIDQLLVKQKVELMEAFTGFETNNKFSIKNALGQKVYFAAEDTDCCTRNMCGSARPFDMKIFDNFRTEVMHLHRPLACSACCFPCCLQSMEVTAPPGNVIGTVEQEWTLCSPAFRIKNHLGDTVLRIEGPFCTLTICGNVDFDIVTLSGEKIGKISKQWSGFAREIFTDADFFGITFPLDLDVRMKAVLLGALFLIDAMFFERSGNRESL